MAIRRRKHSLIALCGLSVYTFGCFIYPLGKFSRNTENRNYLKAVGAAERKDSGVPPTTIKQFANAAAAMI